MFEIVSMAALLGVIADMARRRERSPGLFQAVLVLCWFFGEVAGGGAGYLLARATDSQNPFAWIISGMMLGAAGGAIPVFLWAKLLPPLNGEWCDLSQCRARRSRALGGLIGGLVGAVIGAAVVSYLYGNPLSVQNLPMVIQGSLAVGFVGALLGLVSGLQRKQEEQA